VAEICQNRIADKGRFFEGFLLLKSKSVKIMKEIASQKDILRIFMIFYGATPKSVLGQQHP
jgi:hypothetical protein